MNRNAIGILTIAAVFSLVLTPGSRSNSSLGNLSNPFGATQESSLLLQQRYPPNAENAQPCKTQAESFRAGLFTQIQGSFSTGPAAKGGTSTECQKALALDPTDADHTHVIFALVPDPLHTHLALFFDRQMDALQQGAQDSGWVFEQARMPWDNKTHPESADFRLRESEAKSREEVEQQPGLLIFHHSPASDGSEIRHRLLVLVIGETPTAGVNKTQFRNALNLMDPILRRHSAEPLSIIGPTFSGSLPSLAELLNCSSPPDSAVFACGLQPYVISGTVTDSSSAAAFTQTMGKSKNPAVRHVFQTLQEYDLYAIDRFLTFAGGDYQPDEVAILSEDETGYGQGGQNQPPAQASTDVPGSREAEAVHLYFPREISQLRSAYQRTSATISTPSGNQVRTTLPLDLEATGSETDSVTEYARNQTPLSQEAVLLGIVSELKRHSIRVVLVRATDALDLMFLARYLRSAYPQGRIVTVGSDLLFGREIQNALFHGVMALTTYTLTPGADHRFEPIKEFHSDRVFPASNSVGTYNAMKLMLATLPATLLLQPSAGESPASCKDTPRVHLAQYSYPNLGADEDEKERPDHPPIHLTVLGHDGFWNVAILPPGEAPRGLFATIFHRWTHGKPDVAPFDWDKIPTSLPKVCDPEIQPASVTHHSRHGLPMEWHLFWIFAIIMSVGYAYFIWTASILSSSPAVAHLAPPIRDSRRHLFAITGYLHFALLAALLWASEYYAARTTLEFVVLFVALLLVILVCAKDLLRRGAPLLARIFLFACVLTLAWLSHIWRAGYVDYMFVLRSVTLTSGVSPLLPIVLLLTAGLWAVWYTLSGTALVDERSRLPALPAVRDLGGTAINPDAVHLGILEDDHKDLLRYLRPNHVESRTAILVVLLLLAIAYLAGGTRLVHTLEKPGYERLLSVFIMTILVLLVASAFRLMSIWRKLRQLLLGLDSLPLRRGFKLLKGFSWAPLWQIGVVNMRQLASREIEALESILGLEVGRFDNLIPEVVSVAPRLTAKYDEALRSAADRQDWQLIFSPSTWMRQISRQGELETELVGLHRQLQRTLTKAALYALDFIRSGSNWLVAISMAFEDKAGASSRLSKTIHTLRATRDERERAGEDEKLKGQLDACQRYLALVYTMFIIAVVLRIRNLVIAMGGLYVFFLMGLSIYPFQPQLNIRIWLMALLAFMVVVVGVVYGQMHRDATLSHITDTKPGELGWDFWLRLVSFIAVPLLSLFASQFPEIGSALSSWLQPAINAFKQ